MRGTARSCTIAPPLGPAYSGGCYHGDEDLDDLWSAVCDPCEFLAATLGHCVEVETSDGIWDAVGQKAFGAVGLPSVLRALEEHHDQT